MNESIPAGAASAIERWVSAGGRLWASGWAGMRDEYNTPTDAWNAMLGVRSRSWRPTGDLRRLGKPIEPADWMRPIFAREVTLDPAPQTQPATTRPVHGIAHGAGLICLVPFSAGKAYMDAARDVEGELAKATIFPAGRERDNIARFALGSGADPPRPLRSARFSPGRSGRSRRASFCWSTSPAENATISP